MKKPFLLITLTCGLGIALAQEPAANKPMQVARALPASAPAPQEGTAKDPAPVPLPSQGHFARLWTDSLFTTRAMPLPDAPAGPSFTDNLTLTGTYEDRGKLTAILIDKTTSNIVQVYIGEDNEQGIRISKIVPGATPDQMRIQLQKGNQAGWVQFSDAPAAPAAPAAQPAIQGRVPAIPPRPAGVPMVPQALPYNPATDAAAQTLFPAAAPAMRAGLPGAAPALPDDPPLPPP